MTDPSILAYLLPLALVWTGVILRSYGLGLPVVVGILVYLLPIVLWWAAVALAVASEPWPYGRRPPPPRDPFNRM
jgi:hypothetical protein